MKKSGTSLQVENNSSKGKTSYVSVCAKLVLEAGKPAWIREKAWKRRRSFMHEAYQFGRDFFFIYQNDNILVFKSDRTHNGEQ